MSTIIVNIELDQEWTVYTDPKTGSTHLQALVEEGEKEWIHVLLRTPERGQYEGTKHHNRATIVIKNGEYEEEVSAVISVPHVDDMEERGKGFYKLSHYPAKVDEEE